MILEFGGEKEVLYHMRWSSLLQLGIRGTIIQKHVRQRAEDGQPRYPNYRGGE
jgi:hypothetical protein